VYDIGPRLSLVRALSFIFATDRLGANVLTVLK